MGYLNLTLGLSNCFAGYAKFRGEKRWGIYYERLCTSKNNEIICEEGFQVCFSLSK